MKNLKEEIQIALSFFESENMKILIYGNMHDEP